MSNSPKKLDSLLVMSFVEMTKLTSDSLTLPMVQLSTKFNTHKKDSFSVIKDNFFQHSAQTTESRRQLMLCRLPFFIEVMLDPDSSIMKQFDIGQCRSTSSKLTN